MLEKTNIKRRKQDHIRICLQEDSASTVSNGLDNYSFIHNALPEINKEDIRLSTRFLKKKMSMPVMISSMSGGIERAKKINFNLASAAQELGIAMGVGSQRIMIEDPRTSKTFRIRDVAPDILLFANLGAVQLNNGFSLKECQHVVDSCEADALILHVNPLQEAIQLSGNTNFADLTGKIEDIAGELSVPIVIKEVGSGISYEVAKRLQKAGITIIDIAGSGGTSFAAVESKSNHIGEVFRDWGIPTAESIRQVSMLPNMNIIAGGGIKSGIDVAKALALGADIVSVARPLLGPSLVNAKEVREVLEKFAEQLRIAMFCVGASSIEELKKNQYLVKKYPYS